MGGVYAKRQEMERLKALWYSLVALPLVERIAKLEDNYETILSAYNSTIKELNTARLDVLTVSQEANDWKERASTTNRDGAIAVQVIRERMRGGEMACVLSARDRATKQRIRELETENQRLRRELWSKPKS